MSTSAITRSRDEAVVAAARAGDEAAFSELVGRHQGELQLHCYRMLGSFEDSEDLVQETFLRAWRWRASFSSPGRSSFRAWLYRIATNACLDALQSKPRRLLPSQLGPGADPPLPVLPPICRGCSRTRISCSTESPRPTTSRKRSSWPGRRSRSRSWRRSRCCLRGSARR